MNFLKFYSETYTPGEIEFAPDQIGTPLEDIRFSDGPQDRPDTCAIRTQQYILSMFGIEKSEADLVQEATLYKEYNPSTFEGTSMEDAGNLLERNGLEIHRYMDATMAHLISELGQGHKILVAVDVDELIADTPQVYLAEKIEDAFLRDCNHAVLVTDINPHTMDVTIIDPLDGQLHIVSAKQFQDAWADSRCFMVSTAQSPDEYLQTTGNGQAAFLPSDIDKGEIIMAKPTTNLIEMYTGMPLDASEPSFGSTDAARNEYEPSFGSTDAVRNEYEPSFGSTDAARNEYEPSFGSTDAARNEYEPSFGSTDAAKNEYTPSFGRTIYDPSGLNNPDLSPNHPDNRLTPAEYRFTHPNGPSFGSSDGTTFMELEDAPSYQFSISDIDLVGDNVVMGLDLDHDGVSDLFTMTMDTDGDSIPDALLFDMNADGTPDAFTLDLDVDGTPDAIAVDTDGDGLLDTVLVLGDDPSLI